MRARVGMVLAGILVLPALAGLWMAAQKLAAPVPPEAFSLGLTGLGALVVNLFCAFLLSAYRVHSGSLTRASFLSARNDAIANVAIIAAGFVTAYLWHSAWPDLIVGAGIAYMNVDAARAVWRAAREEHRAGHTYCPVWVRSEVDPMRCFVPAACALDGVSLPKCSGDLAEPLARRVRRGILWHFRHMRRLELRCGPSLEFGMIGKAPDSVWRATALVVALFAITLNFLQPIAHAALLRDGAPGALWTAVCNSTAADPDHGPRSAPTHSAATHECCLGLAHVQVPIYPSQTFLPVAFAESATLSLPAAEHPARAANRDGPRKPRGPPSLA